MSHRNNPFARLRDHHPDPLRLVMADFPCPPLTVRTHCLRFILVSHFAESSNQRIIECFVLGITREYERKSLLLNASAPLAVLSDKSHRMRFTKQPSPAPLSAG